MQGKRNISTLKEKAACLFMIFALVWLTVSLPFVNFSQQVAMEMSADGETENQNSNAPGNNAAEEKTESGSNSLSEYLHDPSNTSLPIPLNLLGYKEHPDAFYAAFHPEMVLPPPEA